MIGILFSGGLDSTYLMWKALKKGHDVYPIYISIKNNQDKILIEKQQCNLIIEELNKEFDKDIILRNFAEIDVMQSNNLTFAQPFLWSTLVNMGLPREITELQIGYVYGDAVISYLPEIKKLYNATKPFITHQPKLTFPLVKVLKNEIINELPKQYKKLVVSCEQPILKPYGTKLNGEKYRFFEPCGNCEICRKIIDNKYYDCEITKKLYSPAEEKYNKEKYKEFKFKVKQYKHSNSVKEASEPMELLTKK